MQGSDEVPDMPGVRIAALMACHNRRERTSTCLRSLQTQDLPPGTLIYLFLTDDGSTDGTAAAVLSIWTDATILRGDGSLYWAASMALAERAAMRCDPDFLLWLNDDTDLNFDAIRSLMRTSSHYPEAIVVGAVADPDTGNPTYGGRVRVDAHPQRFRLLPRSDDVQPADTFNGNVVLIPRSARHRVGPLDGLFAHSYADDDYGLRATRASVQILQAPGIVGQCPRNPPAPPLPGGPWRRWRTLQEPKGLPWRSQVRYLRRHGDWRWPVRVVASQVRRIVRGRA